MALRGHNWRRGSRWRIRTVAAGVRRYGPVHGLTGRVCTAATPLGNHRRQHAGGICGRIDLVWASYRLANTLCGPDPEDARQVGLTLTQAQISYDVADNGMTLRVPAAQLDKARLATAARASRAAGWDSNYSTNPIG